MWTQKKWSRLSNGAFITWVNEHQNQWAVVTFTARKRPFKHKAQDAQMLQEKLISKEFLTTSCSRKELEKALAKTVRTFDIDNLTRGQRKAGRKLKRVAVEGGNIKGGTWNHIHALIEIPEKLDVDQCREVLNRHFHDAMKEACGQLRGRRLETDVWCEPYETNILDDENTNKFLSYCLRPEEDGMSDSHDEQLNVHFDKVILSQVVLNPPLKPWWKY